MEHLARGRDQQLGNNILKPIKVRIFCFLSLRKTVMMLNHMFLQAIYPAKERCNTIAPSKNY